MATRHPGTRSARGTGGALLDAWYAGGHSLSAIADPMLEPVTCLDREGRLVYANDAALRALDLFGGPPVGGYRLGELCAGSDAARIEADDRDAMYCGRASVRDAHLAAAGRAYHWQITRLPLRDPDGCVCGLLGVWVERRFDTSPTPADAAARADGTPAEIDLRANAERFRHLVETLGNVYWILDWRRMRRLYVSPACERLWGLSRREIYAGSGYWLDLVYREDRERVETALAGLEQGLDFQCEYRIVRGNGTLGWVRDRGVPVLGDDGEVDRAIGVCEDISEQRDLVSGMLERERRLDLAIGASGLHVWTFDVDRHRLAIAPSLCALLGLTPRQGAMPGALRRRVHPQDRAAVERAFARCLEEGEDLDVEFRVSMGACPDHWLSVRATRIDGAGDGRNLYGVAADVTTRRADELRLRERDREFRTLVENAPDIIARLDRELRFRYINAAVGPALGMKAADFIGRSAAEMGLPPAMRETIESGVHQVFERGREQGAIFDLDGRAAGQGEERRRHFQARFIPEFTEGDAQSVESVLMIVYDVTSRHRAQRERERLLAGERSARERAEAASHARDQFLSIVSHELRSPLNAIQSWTRVLETQVRDDAPPVKRRALAGIRSGVEQQVRLIEDLLDATRILSGRLGLSISLVRLAPVIEAAVAQVQEDAGARDVTIELQLDREHDGVQGDPQRLQQIAWNLLRNAVKFSPAGARVRVSLEREGSTVRLRVSDQGKGFDAAFLPRLFDWFQREESGAHRRHEGLGLGLALVRHLTELHGGHVAASSAGPGKGATFEVRLPLAADASAVRAQGGHEAPVSARSSLTGVRVMLVDDKAEAREALGALLVAMGANVTSFASGPEALDWLRERGPAHGLDVLLCDLAMPVQDGYATLLRLRALEDEFGVTDDRRLPAIAVTAFAQHEDRVRALNAGFALHVAKPVSPEELAAAIESELRPRASSHFA